MSSSGKERQIRRPFRPDVRFLRKKASAVTEHDKDDHDVENELANCSRRQA